MAKILWLASWYPNTYEPFNGDFIKRHAESVAEVMPVDIIHVLQTGSASAINKTEEIINTIGNLREFIYAFAYKPTGIKFIDKARYNYTYKRYYIQVIKNYIKVYGKPSLVHVHVPMKAGMIARRMLKKYKIPYAVSEQASHYELAAPDNFFKRSFFFKRNSKKIFRGAIAVTNVSATIGKQIAQIFNISQVKTIHNVVDTSKFFYLPKSNSSLFTFLHVSSLNKQKNPEGIIEALALLKQTRNDWRCVMCGPAATELIQFAKAKGLKNEIAFTGEIPYAQVAIKMQHADAFILFSKHENFPCVVIEALCCGLPVVSANAGGIAEAVNAGNGYLVTSGEVKELTKKLNDLITNYNIFNGQSISANATALYNKNVIAKQFIELYRLHTNLQDF